MFRCSSATDPGVPLDLLSQEETRVSPTPVLSQGKQIPRLRDIRTTESRPPTRVGDLRYEFRIGTPGEGRADECRRFGRPLRERSDDPVSECIVLGQSLH